MQRCLYLAQLGEGSVAPNPMVGAVLVHNDRIIGEGYHRRFGEAHAEVACLQSAQENQRHLISESTMYVSLEPCAHFGKTPPCADLIILHKIPRVVAGCADPFPAVSGKGFEKLRAAGVEVTVGVLERDCRRLNKRFVTVQEKNRPYIILKWAQTADGKMGTESGNPIRISNEYSARLVHRMRSQNMSILVGTNTAFFDDPELTTRHWPGRHPVRLVLDKTLRLPTSLKLFDGQHPTIVFNEIRQQNHPNLMYQKTDAEQNITRQIIRTLYEKKLQSVLVEGGAQTLQSFIDADLWDEAVVITAQQMALGKGLAAPRLQHHRLVQTESVFSDVIHTYAHERNTLL